MEDAQTTGPTINDLIAQLQTELPWRKRRQIVLSLAKRAENEIQDAEEVRTVAQEALNILLNDTEENACTALKLLVELHKLHRNLEDQTEPFFRFVKECLGNVNQIVHDMFDEPVNLSNDVKMEGHESSGSDALSIESDPGDFLPSTGPSKAEIPPEQQSRSRFSFKVLGECPVMLVLLFQMYKKTYTAHVHQIVPLFMDFISCKAKAQDKWQTEFLAANNGTHCGIVPNISNRPAYWVMIEAQVRALSFLSYVLRTLGSQYRMYALQVGNAIVSLLVACPVELPTVRKELLVGARHVCTVEFRPNFVNHMHILLQEETLVGPGITTRPMLRPVAYSMLADLIHHARPDLDAPLLLRIVHVYCQNLHDIALTVSIHTMCVKLLGNIIDTVVALSDKVEAHKILSHIVISFAQKFRSLRMIFGRILADKDKLKSLGSKDKRSPEAPVDTANLLHSHTLDLEFSIQPIKTNVHTGDVTVEAIRDNKFLFKSMIHTMKGIMFSIRSCQDAIGSKRIWGPDEAAMFTPMFADILCCFDIYHIDMLLVDISSNGRHPVEIASHKNIVAREEKEGFDHFAAVYTYIDSHIFQEVCSVHVKFLVERTLLNPNMIAIPQFFLGNENVTQSFASILLRYLMENLDSLSNGDEAHSVITIRHFKLIFMAVGLYPGINETILRPHLQNLVMGCLRSSYHAKDPMNYFTLMRALFRGIGGGKFEMLYKEVLPLLPSLLEGLNGLLFAAQKQSMKELFVELLLTVPVRLSVLLPYLHYLMKPLVLALQAGPDLIQQGLRTLELCVDNLTSEFLDPLMTPVRDDLMLALWGHLRPIPYNQNHAHATLRILGKLGGRNRKYLLDPPHLKCKSLDSGLNTNFSFDSSRNVIQMSLDDALALALRILRNMEETLQNKTNAFSFAKHVLPMCISLQGGSGPLAKLLSDRSSSAEQFSPINLQREEGNNIINSVFTLNVAPGMIERKQLQELSLGKILLCIFLASTVPPLKEEAGSLCRTISTHIAILNTCEVQGVVVPESDHSTEEDLQIRHTLKRHVSHFLSTAPFINSLVDFMTSEEDTWRSYGRELLRHFYNVMLRIWGKERIGKLKVFEILGNKFATTCYKHEWFRKVGACEAIGFLTIQLDLGVQYMLANELEFIRAILFILKDATTEIAPKKAEDTVKILSHILKVCQGPHESDDIKDENKERRHANVINFLIVELSNPNHHVREVVKSCFQLMADLVGNELTDVLSPVKDRLLAPIFAKPLRALPFNMQIGHIDAITYCLSLRPPLLAFDEDLDRLLSEALALADAEDANLTNKNSHYKQMPTLIKLRVACITLLSAAMLFPEFGSAQPGQRNRVIQVYFKSIYSKSSEVVDVAKKGLSQIITQQQKLPKELLQNGLRPVLASLADFKRLSADGLEGLGRLLELLTTYFKPEIGKKLLDHINLWSESVQNENLSDKLLNEREDVKVMIATLDVFYLLPAAAIGFLDDLMIWGANIEALLMRKTSNPFHQPLLKFVNRYAEPAAIYFVERLSQSNHARLLFALLEMEDGKCLRSEIMRVTETMLVPLFNNSYELQLRLLRLVLILARRHGDWLGGHPKLMECLHLLWKSDRFNNRDFLEEEQDVISMDEASMIVECFIIYSRKQLDQVWILFEMTKAFTMKSIMDFTFVKQYMYDEVILASTLEQKRQIMLYFFNEVYLNPDIGAQVKVQHIRIIILPVMYASFVRGEQNELLSGPVIDAIQGTFWRSALQPDADLESINDALKVESLQITALMILWAPEVLKMLNRQDFMSYCNRYMLLDDVVTKHTAYVLLSMFLAADSTDSTTMMMTTFTSLLTGYAIESRALVRQALDILARALPRNMAVADTNPPGWIETTQRCLAKEGYVIPQILTIWQFIIRHPDLYFAARSAFIAEIVILLPRLGLALSATGETRTLAIEMTELVLKWERKRVTIEANQENPDADYAVDMHSRETILGFLIRYACSVQELPNRKGTVHRCSELMRGFLSAELWQDTQLPLGFFERLIQTADITEANITQVSNILDILDCILEKKAGHWILSNAGCIRRIVEKCLGWDRPTVVRPLHKIILKTFSTFCALQQPVPTEINLEKSAFVSLIEQFVNESFNNFRNLYSSSVILNTISSVKAEFIDSVLQSLIKLIQKLVKEYIPRTTSAPSPPQSTENVVSLLITSLQLANSRMSQMTELRKWYMSSFVQLAEKCTDIELCHILLSIARGWILNQDDPFPTMKEKAGALHKMIVFEERNDDKLWDEYLDLVAKIYTTPELLRTELTARLEQAFLLGSCQTSANRSRFGRILDDSVPRGLYIRLHYVLGVHNWEYISDKYWLKQALSLLLGAVQSRNTAVRPCDMTTVSLRAIERSYESAQQTQEDMALECEVRPEISELVSEHIANIRKIHVPIVNELVHDLEELMYLDVDLTYKMWCDLFPLLWRCLSSKERLEISRVMSNLLSQNYQEKQMFLRPNVIQGIMHGISRCQPIFALPPTLSRYLGKTFNAWHTAIEILHKTMPEIRPIDPGVAFKPDEKNKEHILDALVEIYTQLNEEDMVYGLWRRRCLLPETSTAIFYEQNGMWSQAQEIYENAQLKARNGQLAFIESEYTFWEDHWITCAQKLQQWEMLLELSKGDAPDLYLESAWRQSDWSTDKEMLRTSIAAVTELPTPKRKVYEAFFVLNQVQENLDKVPILQGICDDGIQLTLAKWASLPPLIAQAHVPLLHLFQQFVELSEAQTMYTAISPSNLNPKAQIIQELKATLGVWRDRLPNVWDDITLWSELVSWRQHIFNAVNASQYGSTSNEQTQMANFQYRGFHEIAWIINRFANVARKHQLVDVCIHALLKIYTLPNIEIFDAFLKLKEQAKCYLQSNAELSAGLEVVNNTNLSYFHVAQRAEFFALKGIFLTRLGRSADADAAFSNAIQIDGTSGKGWAAWGQYNDNQFKTGGDVCNAENAINCYLHAAGLFKDERSVGYLGRVLWLLGCNHSQAGISPALEAYKGDNSPWYWIPLIPQLLTSLQRPEGIYTKPILFRIANHYPQALHYHLRTAREEISGMKSTNLTRTMTPPEAVKTENVPQGNSNPTTASSQDVEMETPEVRTASYPHTKDLLDEILNEMKKAHPLLGLSMETLAEQIVQRLKPLAEDDMYRVITALMTEVTQLYTSKFASNDTDDMIPSSMRNTLGKVANTHYVSTSKFKAPFHQDFLHGCDTLSDLLMKLRVWKDRLEHTLDTRPRVQQLEVISNYMTEFEHNKFDEIEVPGQYDHMLKTSPSNQNTDFVRIERFVPEVIIVRSHGLVRRRFVIIGSDGAEYPFWVQNPAARNARREEAVLQVGRFMNNILERRKETRRRNLQLHCPATVSIAATVRIIQDDTSYFTLHDVLEDHFIRSGLEIDEPVMFYIERMRNALQQNPNLTESESINLRTSILEQIASKMVPPDTLKKYMYRAFLHYNDLWVFRKRFAAQMAAVSFLTYVMGIGQRHPHKMFISKATGNVFPMDIQLVVSTRFLLLNQESVPFRLTPNIQTFLSPEGIEGVYLPSIIAIARALTEPSIDMEHWMSLFMRDELHHWRKQFPSPSTMDDKMLKERCLANVHQIMKRTLTVSCKNENNEDCAIPSQQPVLDLVSNACNPTRLTLMDPTWMAWC